MSRGAAGMKNHWKYLVMNGGGLNCAICDIPFTANDEITLDHIMPLALDGKHRKNNWQPAHYLCNQSKGANAPSRNQSKRFTFELDSKVTPPPLA